MIKKIPKKRFQKEEPKKIIFIAGIILLFLLFLFGCTELSGSEKGLCYTLSTKSYTTIPACDTEDSCFSKVNELFKTKFNYSQESKLFELKNNVARSWLFFNKANAKIKNVGKICQGTDYSELPSELNEAQNYLEQSFSALDEAMKQSFEFIGAEEEYLTEQKIDIIKEEKIFDSLTELRQIITELNTGPTNSDSYVSYYLNKAQTFSNSNITKGIPPLIEKQPILTETYNFTEESILKKLGITNEYWFPTLNSAFENGRNYFENLIYSKQGILSLKKFPVSEFTTLYSNLGGKDTSALKRFIDLTNRTSTNIETTQNSINLLWKENEKKLIECKNNFNTLEDYSSFEDLYSSLLGAIAINKTETKDKLDRIIKETRTLSEKKSKGSLAMGGELSTLKRYSAELSELNLRITLEKENYTSKLSSACDNLAKTIKSEIPSESEELSKLIYDTQFDSTKILSTTGKEKLTYCSKLNKELTLLKNAKKDSAAFAAERKDSAKDCFTYLEKIFHVVELNELKNTHKELSKTQVTKENLTEFIDSCENIKRQVEYIIGEDEEVIACEKEILYAEKNLLTLNEISLYDNSSKITQTQNQYTLRLIEYKKYFNKNGTQYNAKLDILLPIKSNLNEKIKNLNNEIKQAIKENITNYAQSNIQINQINDFVAENEKDYNSIIEILIPNPFETISEEILLKVPIKPKKITRMGECINKIVPEKDYSTIILACLPAGGTSIEIAQEETLDTIETEELLFASNKESLIKRTITLTNTSTIEKALLHTALPNGTTKTVVLNKEKEIKAYSETETLFFALEKIRPKEEITIYFYVDNLINIITTINNKTLNADIQKITYLSIAKNTLPKKVSANLLLDIPINSNVETFYIYKNGNEIVSGKPQGNYLLIPNQIFEEKQTINYEIQLTVNNYYSYYLEELTKQREELILLGEIDSAKSISDLIAQGEKSPIKTLQAKYLETTALLNKLNLAKNEKLSQNLLKQNVLDKIEELRSQIEEFNNLGLNKEATEIETLIQGVLNLDFGKQSNITKAFDTLSKKTFSFDDTLKENANNLLKKVEEVTKNTSSEELIKLKEKFLKEKQSFEQLFPFNPIEGKENYTSLQKTLTAIINLKEELDQNSTKKIKENQKEINKFKEINLKLIEELDLFFASGQNSIKNKIIPPITQSRLFNVLMYSNFLL